MKIIFCILICISLCSSNLLAQEAKWEVGIGIGGITLPHYPGSDETLELILPVPYGSYKDDRTKIDRNGLHYDLFGINDLDLSLSFGVGFPIDSDENKAREGMQDLNPIFEVGPSFKYWLFKNKKSKLSLELPIRAAVAFDDFSTSNQGLTGDLKVNYEKKIDNWKLSAFYRMLFADRKYHSQYYDVDLPFVTPERSFYRSKKGISGHAIGFTASLRFDNYYFGLYSRYENLSNAANHDSPLLKSDHNLYFSAVFSWVFATNDSRK